MLKAKGFTLVEVLIASGLSLLLVGLFLGVLGPTLRATGRNSARISLQQSALLALNRMSKELQASCTSGIGILPPVVDGDPTVLSIHRISDVVNTMPASRAFDSQLIVYSYLPASHQIRRRLWPEPGLGETTLDGLLEPPTATLALRPEPRSLLYFARNPGPRERILVGQVRRFIVSSKSLAPEVTPPLSLTLELEGEMPGSTQPYRFELSQSLSPRNSE